MPPCGPATTKYQTKAIVGDMKSSHGKRVIESRLRPEPIVSKTGIDFHDAGCGKYEATMRRCPAGWPAGILSVSHPIDGPDRVMRQIGSPEPDSMFCFSCGWSPAAYSTAKQ
jgi:hypothetical protein